MFARDLFNAMPTKAAVYTDSLDTFPLRMNIVETDQAFRMSNRGRLIGSAVSGTVMKDARIRKGGRITVGTTEYRVDGVVPSPLPGLSDLKLDRRAGPAIWVVDAADILPTPDTITINGEDIRANVNHSVEVEEVGENGSRAIVSRMMVAIRAADAERLGVKAGTRVHIDGARKTVGRAMADGVGMVKLLI
ncbi:hypothetical protein [Paracoccus sp. SSK6]|uniref:hypothetical protein n=1 Tax=Paracoccus sp. SSK6 TaxID=3143131 RepID=UPI00321AAFA6